MNDMKDIRVEEVAFRGIGGHDTIQSILEAYHYFRELFIDNAIAKVSVKVSGIKITFERDVS